MEIPFHVSRIEHALLVNVTYGVEVVSGYLIVIVTAE